MISGRSYTISAGVAVESDDAQGVLYAHGGVAGGHSLFIKDRRLHYVFNWVGTSLQTVTADREITRGRHVFVADFIAKGRSGDPAMPGAAGTVTLYIDDQAVGSADIITQPGLFNAVGDGICVGRDDGSPVTPDYSAPFRFTGGAIDKVVVDVSGERYIDHEAQVRGWFMID
jgi:arylsulfatase